MKTDDKPAKVLTHQVVEALRQKYDDSQGKWACIEEVADQTGGCNRRCDFLAMGCWRSVGLHLHGMEIKVSRSDWQKELQDITKADAFARYCHKWWLVFANKAAKLEEVPADWGVMECLPSGSLKVRRQAAKRDPAALPWTFLASLLRAACGQYRRQSFRADALRKEYERGHKDAHSRDKWRADNAEKRAKKAEHTLEKLRELGPSGNHWWSDEHMVRDLRAALEFLNAGQDNWLDAAIQKLERDRERIDQCLDVLYPHAAQSPAPSP